MKTKKLQLGILLDSYQVTAWSYKMIENIQNSDYAEIKLVIMNKGSETSNLTQDKTVTRKALDKLYHLLIERNTYLPNAYATQDCSKLLDHAEIIELSPTVHSNAQYFSATDIEKIEKLSLDVIINNGFAIIKGDILKAAKHGIWSYHYADHKVNKSSEFGFKESMENWPATGSMLQILTEELCGGKVLCQSFSCTDKMSVQDNRSALAWKSLSFMTRKLKELHDIGDDDFIKKLASPSPLSFYSKESSAKYSNWELTKLFFSKFMQKIYVLISNKRYFNQWIMMFHISDSSFPPLAQYTKMIPPKDRFWADPHIVYKDNKYYIFIEELLYKTNSGNISFRLKP